MEQNFVAREGNQIQINGKLNKNAAHWVVARLNEAKNKGYEDFKIDCTPCTGAFPDGLVPVAAFVDSWRADGLDFDIVLPNEETTAKLMLNCNFAHFVRPDAHSYHETLLSKHVSIRRFDTLKAQVATVKEFVNVALNTMDISRDVLQGMEWSLNEVMDNVLIHASANRGGFAQATTLENHVAFTVADCGRGILSSLREGFPALSRDTDAIAEAIKAGVTRNPDVGQGNGLAGSLRIATLSGGGFSVSSGCGILSVFSENGSTESRGNHVPWFQGFPGTVVSVQIVRQGTFKISEALNFPNFVGGVLDVIETDLETADGKAFIVQMQKDAPGFGNREGGAQIRQRITNLLKADNSKPVCVDWEGVPLISSSFADESFGKLFMELGPIQFSSRIRHLGLEPLVRGLIDKAIIQRTLQKGATATSPGNPASAAIEFRDGELPH